MDHRSFNVEIYGREFSWLYYNPVDEGFKCKICKLFPAIGCSHTKHKFGQVASKSLGDHPKHHALPFEVCDHMHTPRHTPKWKKACSRLHTSYDSVFNKN